MSRYVMTYKKYMHFIKYMYRNIKKRNHKKLIRN